MKRAWIIIVFGLILEFYLMTEPAFLFLEPVEEIEDSEEIIFTEDEEPREKTKVMELIDKEIKTLNPIIKSYRSVDKYYFEFYYDKKSEIDWKQKVKEYELYLGSDCEIFLVSKDNPERIIKNYD